MALNLDDRRIVTDHNGHDLVAQAATDASQPQSPSSGPGQHRPLSRPEDRVGDLDRPPAPDP